MFLPMKIHNGPNERLSLTAPGSLQRTPGRGSAHTLSSAPRPPQPWGGAPGTRCNAAEKGWDDCLRSATTQQSFTEVGQGGLRCDRGGHTTSCMCISKHEGEGGVGCIAPCWHMYWTQATIHSTLWVVEAQQKVTCCTRFREVLVAEGSLLRGTDGTRAKDHIIKHAYSATLCSYGASPSRVGESPTPGSASSGRFPHCLCQRCHCVCAASLPAQRCRLHARWQRALCLHPQH